jgi:hypothetical protein
LVVAAAMTIREPTTQTLMRPAYALTVSSNSSCYRIGCNESFAMRLVPARRLIESSRRGRLGLCNGHLSRAYLFGDRHS